MKRMIVVALTALLVVAVLIAGCGGKKTDQDGTSNGKLDAKTILEKSNEAMREIKSVRTTGDYDIQAPGMGYEDVTFQMEMELVVNGPEDVSGRIIMVDAQTGEQVLYMDDGIVYFEVPGQGWYKQPLSSAAGVSSTPTPQEMEQFSKAAENMKITSEDGTSWTISFDIGSKYLEEAMKGSETTEGLTPELQSMVEEILKTMKMSAVFKITKSSYLLEAADVKMSMEGGEGLGSMSADVAMTFSDFDQQFDVALPPEAASAQEAPSTGGLLPGVPGGETFPGL